MKISSLVYKEVQNYKDQQVILPDGTGYNQYNTLLHINRYTQNKFWNINTPDALFWNLATPRIPLFAKSIDMDSKDFFITGNGPKHWFQAFLLNVRFQKWIKDTGFALTLDDVAESIATYGSAVWKKVYNVRSEVALEEIDLRFLFFDPTVPNVIESPIVEMHYLSASQIRHKYGDEADDIMDAAKSYEYDGENYNEIENQDITDNYKFEIWERWGQWEKDDLTDQTRGEYYQVIGAGEGDSEYIIFEQKVSMTKYNTPKNFPYYDFHVSRFNGRWMRIGVVERLFPLQFQCNTLVNQNNEANQIASLLLFRTSDPNTAGNLLQGAISGQIINSTDLNQLPVDNRFIQTFLNQLTTIENKSDALCFINESITGETPPSGVPFRSMAIAQRAALSTFNYIKSSIGEKMSYILQDDILPELVKEFNREEMIAIAHDDRDVRMYDDTVVEKTKQEFIEEKTRRGEVVFEEDITQIETITRGGLEQGRLEVIPKGFFNFDYGISMNATGERIDKAVQNGAIDAALEMLTANPALANNPLFQQKLANNNIPPFKLTPQEQQEVRVARAALPTPPTNKLDQLAAQ